MNAVLLIAHAPLANALRQGALHVFPDAAADIAALDVDPDAPPEQTRAVRLLAGVNLPMLLRAVSYRAESLDAMAQRALAGGVQGVMPVASAAPQNQSRKVPHDQDRHDHHQ